MTASAYPGALDTFPSLTPTTRTDTCVPHAALHVLADDAIAALQAKVGIDSSANHASIDWLIRRAISLTTGAITGSTSRSVPVWATNGFVNGNWILVNDGTNALYGQISGGGGTATLTISATGMIVVGTANSIATGSSVVLAGAPGAAGANGTNGTNGTNGSAGTAGAIGPTGAAGAIGPTGAAGATGPAGATGATGTGGSGSSAGLTGGICFYDDFICGVPGATPSGGSQTYTSASGTGSVITATLWNGHPGALKLSTGTTTGGIARLFGAASSATTGILVLGDGSLELTASLLMPSSLSNATDRYAPYFGLSNTSANVAFTDAVYAYYRDDTNSGKPIIRSVVAGTTQTDANGTATTMAASTAYRWRLVFNAARTQVDLYTKVGTGSETLECSYTGLLPAITAQMGVLVGITKYAGTNNRDLVVDYWQANYTLTNQR